MENKEKLGQESAFPIEYQEFNSFGEFKRTEFGINKRFYAACVAVQGILANINTARQVEKALGDNPTIEDVDAIIVRASYRIADELLKQEKL